MRKLRDTEVRLLTLLRDKNTTVHIMPSPTGNHAFISDAKNGPQASRWLKSVTILNLKHLGLVENITNADLRWRGSEYRVTQLGLDAIREANQR